MRFYQNRSSLALEEGSFSLKRLSQQIQKAQTQIYFTIHWDCKTQRESWDRHNLIGKQLWKNLTWKCRAKKPTPDHKRAKFGMHPVVNKRSKKEKLICLVFEEDNSSERITVKIILLVETASGKLNLAPSNQRKGFQAGWQKANSFLVPKLEVLGA